MLNEAGVIHAVVSLFVDPTVNAQLRNPYCQKHLEVILQILGGRAISDRMRSVINYLLADMKSAYSAGGRKDFRELALPYVRFS